jgi:hypothetical protein
MLRRLPSVSEAAVSKHGPLSEPSFETALTRLLRRKSKVLTLLKF